MRLVDCLHDELVQTDHLYLPCENCNYGSHGLFFEVLHWRGDEVNTFECGLKIHASKGGLWERLRWAWRVLCGREYEHEIILSETATVRLRDFIQDQVKIVRWRDLPTPATEEVPGVSP